MLNIFMGIGLIAFGALLGVITTVCIVIGKDGK